MEAVNRLVKDGKYRVERLTEKYAELTHGLTTVTIKIDDYDFIEVKAERLVGEEKYILSASKEITYDISTDKLVELINALVAVVEKGEKNA